jgi:hypothetical protein
MSALINIRQRNNCRERQLELATPSAVKILRCVTPAEKKVLSPTVYILT